MGKKIFFYVSVFLITSFCVYSLDVVDTANKEFLTIEETLTLAKKKQTENRKLISDLVHLKKLIDEGKCETEEIYESIDRLPYMPCTEAIRLLVSSDEEVLNSANYIYSVFTGCPKGNPLKDQVYLKILEASMKEDNYSWSYNAARDLSDKAKENPVYKSFMTAISQN